MKKISIIILYLLWCQALFAQTSFDTVTVNFKNELLPTEKLTYILNYCELNVGKYPKEIKNILYEAKDYIIRNKLTYRNAEYFYQWANYFATLHNFDSARSYYLKSLELVAENNLTLKSVLHIKIASAYRRQEQLQQAIENIETAFNYCKLSNNNTLLADALIELGNINCELDLFNQALSKLQEAIGIYKTNKDTLKVIDGYIQLGNLFSQWENFPMAIDYYDKALALAQKIKQIDNASAIYLLKSKVYYKMGEIKESYLNSQLAFDNYNTTNNKYKKAFVMNQLGLIESKRKNFELSKDLFVKGITIFNENDDLLGKAESLTNLGDLLLALQKGPEAINKYKEALSIAEYISYPSLRLVLFEKIANSYSISGDFKMAMNFQTLYYVMNRQKITDEFQLKLSTLENRLNFEKQELAAGQAELLDALTQERKDKKNWIISAISLIAIILIALAFYYTKTQKKISDKNLLLSNKLQRLNRQHEYLQNLKSQIEDLNKTLALVFSVTTQNISEAVRKLRELIDISKTLPENNELLIEELRSESFIMSYNLLENLLFFSRLQLEKIEVDPHDFYIKPLIQEVVKIQQPRASAKKVEMMVSIDDQISGYFDYQLIEIALRNIVENAIKFSTFESEVHIQAKKEMGSIQLIITDNGIGLTRDQLIRTFSSNKSYMSQGTHGEKGGGLGLLLSKVFIERNFGTLAIESSIAIGTKVVITLPNSKTSLIKNN